MLLSLAHTTSFIQQTLIKCLFPADAVLGADDTESSRYGPCPQETYRMVEIHRSQSVS